MADWGAFAGLVGVVCVLLLVLSRLTQQALSPVEDGDETGPGVETETASTDRREGPEAGPPDPAFGRGSEPTSGTRRVGGEGGRTDGANLASRNGAGPDRPRSRVGDAPFDHADGSEPVREPARTRSKSGSVAARLDDQPLTTGVLLANVAITQGLFAALVVGAAIYTGVPADALGIEFTGEYVRTGLLVGTVVGVVLYLANEIGAALAERFGIDRSEELREMLAPDSAAGWLVLLAVVLPIIAIFEESLFRAALIGATSAGFGVDPWLLAVLSSVLFAVGHGIQGPAGIAVTGMLGFVLAAVFIFTGSVLVVVVAHYVVNAFEFVVHEGLGFEWADRGLGVEAETDGGGEATSGVDANDETETAGN